MFKAYEVEMDLVPNHAVILHGDILQFDAVALQVGDSGVKSCENSIVVHCSQLPCSPI